MGGDGGATVSVAAARSQAGFADLVLVGDKQEILRADPKIHEVCEILHAESQLSASDSLREILRHRTDSSMYMALDLLRQNSVDGVVSGGDTRALMSLSRHLLGMVAGLDRPAIAKEMLGRDATFWMADLGANVRCTPDQLLQIVAMSQLAAKYLSGHNAPTVALLNIGTEVYKGTGELAPVYARLKQTLGADFVGYIEGNELFNNRADVVVCDGYVGNITLKAVEGTAALARHMLQQQLGNATFVQRLLLRMLRSKLRSLAAGLDTQQYNGAAFLGLQGVVVKSHGGATIEGFSSAIRRTKSAIDEQLPSLLAEHLQQQLNQQLP